MKLSRIQRVIFLLTATSILVIQFMKFYHDGIQGSLWVVSFIASAVFFAVAFSGLSFKNPLPKIFNLKTFKYLIAVLLPSIFLGIYGITSLERQKEKTRTAEAEISLKKYMEEEYAKDIAHKKERAKQLQTLLDLSKKSGILLTDDETQ